MERNIESALRVSSVGGLASGELLISKAQPTDLIRLGNFLHNFLLALLALQRSPSQYFIAALPGDLLLARANTLNLNGSV
ncbi:hypothetical protein [Pseudomonas syringae]|uniref:hypothetical protein n=1 Tax=Pseudomonas syringae TaxID=317 RepID=UPI000F005397|nr:hypothetical protein [Pseudomonas azotoformans]